MKVKASNHRSVRGRREASTDHPFQLMDPVTKVMYVLMPIAQYQQVQPYLRAEDFSAAGMYPALERMAGAAGWDDPVMDEYNDYDAHRSGQ